MIEKDTLRKLIVEYQEFIQEVDLKARPFSLEENGRYVFVGIRQAGKSYFMYQHTKALIAAGHSIQEICYVNFDDERLMEMNADSLDSIIEAYRSLYAHEPILFLDEIQNIFGWEKFARRLANQKYRVYITGSNAKMLSKEIASTLGERYMVQLVYPYSFVEYLGAKDMQIAPNWEFGSQRTTIRRLFEEYFRFGGFPEALMYAHKRIWMNGLFERIFFNDIVVRNKVKNVGALRLTIKRLAENVMQPVSSNRLSNLIKDVGYATNTASILDYMKYLRDSCLLFSLPNYAGKFGEKEGIKKHYFMDNGILNLFLTNPDSALLENMCAIRLHKKYHEKLFYYKRNVEVDFYVPDESLAVQATYSLSDLSVYDREVGALEKLNAYSSLNRMVIVSMDEEKEITLGDGSPVEVVPIWKWLLRE